MNNILYFKEPKDPDEEAKEALVTGKHDLYYALPVQPMLKHLLDHPWAIVTLVSSKWQTNLDPETQVPDKMTSVEGSTEKISQWMPQILSFDESGLRKQEGGNYINLRNIDKILSQLRNPSHTGRQMEKWLDTDSEVQVSDVMFVETEAEKITEHAEQMLLVPPQ